MFFQLSKAFDSFPKGWLNYETLSIISNGYGNGVVELANWTLFRRDSFIFRA